MLNTDSLYKSMCRAFSTTTTNTSFSEDFITACNLALDELSFNGDVTTAHAHVVAQTANISTLDEQDAYILQAGVVYHLMMLGWPHKAAANNPNLLAQGVYPSWKSAKGDYMVRLSRDTDQATSTQDEDGVSTNDIIGIGYTGDQ